MESPNRSIKSGLGKTIAFPFIFQPISRHTISTFLICGYHPQSHEGHRVPDRLIGFVNLIYYKVHFHTAAYFNQFKMPHRNIAGVIVQLARRIYSVTYLQKTEVSSDSICSLAGRASHVVL